MNLFSTGDLAEPEIQIDRLGEYPFSEKLRDEYESLGFYLSGHPLDQYRGLERKLQIDRAADITAEESRYADRQRVRMLGQSASKKLIATKDGQTMCFITFEDRSGTLEAVVFPGVYQESLKTLQSGEPFILEGSVSQKEDEAPKVLASRIFSLEQAGSQAAQCLYLKLNSAGDRRIPETLRLLQDAPGEVEVRLFFADEGKYRYPPGKIRVKPDSRLLDELEGLLGAENVTLK